MTKQTRSCANCGLPKEGKCKGEIEISGCNVWQPRKNPSGAKPKSEKGTELKRVSASFPAMGNMPLPSRSAVRPDALAKGVNKGFFKLVLSQPQGKGWFFGNDIENAIVKVAEQNKAKIDFYWFDQYDFCPHVPIVSLSKSEDALEQIKERWAKDVVVEMESDGDFFENSDAFDKMFSEIRELLDREITCKKCFVLDEWHEQAKELALKDKRIAELEGGEDSKLASLEAAHELGIRHAKKQAERIAALEKECAISSRP